MAYSYFFSLELDIFTHYINVVVGHINYMSNHMLLTRETSGFLSILDLLSSIGGVQICLCKIFH